MQGTITCADLRILLDRNEPTTLLDVRRADDRAKEPLAIPAAVWHDPAAIDDWGAKLSKVDEKDCEKQGIVIDSPVSFSCIRLNDSDCVCGTPVSILLIFIQPSLCSRLTVRRRVSFSVLITPKAQLLSHWRPDNGTV